MADVERTELQRADTFPELPDERLDVVVDRIETPETLDRDVALNPDLTMPPISGETLSLSTFSEYEIQAEPKGKKKDTVESANSLPDQNWYCPRCTFENSVGRMQCEMCTCPKPGSSLASSPAMSTSASMDREEEEDISNKEETKGWQCLLCTFINSLDSPVCQICQALPPLAKSQGDTVLSAGNHLHGLTRSRAQTAQRTLSSDTPPLPAEKPPINKQFVKQVHLQEKKQDQFFDKLRQSKNKKQLTKKLNNSIIRLQEQLKVHNKRIAVLEADRDATQGQKEEDIEKWGDYAQHELVDAARTFYENKLLLQHMSIHIETQYRDCFSNKIKILTKISADKRNKRLEFDDYICAIEAAMTTASHIRLPKSIRQEEQQQKELVSVVATYEENYNRAVEQQDLHTDEVRVTEFRELLDQVLEGTAKVDNMFWYPLNQGDQLRFDSFLFDVRCREGRYIKVWLERQNEAKDDLTYQKINEFLDRLTNTVCDSYKIDFDSTSNDFDAVRLLTHRAMMSRVNYLVADCPDPDDAEKDIILQRKVMWMRSLKQDKLHIKPEFCMNLDAGPDQGRTNYDTDAVKNVGSGVPYAEAIRHISAMRSTKVASDCVVHLVNCVTSIEVTAKQYANDNEVMMSADDFFPIIVYCLVHSGLENAHRVVTFLETFLPENCVLMGQPAFCLSLLKAACGYIIRQMPSNFDYPDEIEM